MTQNEEITFFFDFDSTLFSTPTPNTGKEQWERVKGTKYPHKGWWGRKESLDMDVFDIKPIPEVETIYREVITNPKHHAVLLTNRQYFLSDEIKKILDTYSINFEVYSYKQNADEKGERILKIMQKHYPNIKNIIFLDDDQRNIDNAETILEDKGYNLKTIKISSDLDNE